MTKLRVLVRSFPDFTDISYGFADTYMFSSSCSSASRFFFFACDDDHPLNDLIKSGYKQNMKVKNT
jgi:hypothetical protein